MIGELAQRVTRILSVRRALAVLEREPAHVLLIAPSTRSAFALVRALCATRPCFVSNGPVSSSACWKLGPHLRTPAEIAQALAGQSVLPRTVVSFPDQLSCAGPCVQIPFLDGRYAFSSIEALLVARHRPPVFALTGGSSLRHFKLHEVRYDELFSVDGRLFSLPGLVRRLVMHLEQELTKPPPDWLAQPYLALKSEAARWFQAREELKDVECLLRMHLQSRYCDRLRTATALAAVVARRRLFTGR